MALIKKRGAGQFQVTIKHRRLIAERGRPYYATLATREAAVEFAQKLEQLLDEGKIPPELLETSTRAAPSISLARLVHDYLAGVHLSSSEQKLIQLAREELGSRSVDTMDYRWAEAWIHELKARALAPATIRHRVGAVARCLDWHARRTGDERRNPLRMLPRGYARYAPADAAAAGLKHVDQAPRDVERDRRLDVDEERQIRSALAGEKRPDRERALELPEAEAFALVFDLALETAMRLSEIYTLSADQVDLAARTIFLERTKNGDSRQVPLTRVAIKLLRPWLRNRVGRLFPWWNGKRDDRERVTSLLSRAFARLFDYAGCEDLHFHDLRHEATCRLFLRTDLSDIEIARITGHRDLRSLRRYASLRGSDLAKRLW